MHLIETKQQEQNKKKQVPPPSQSSQSDRDMDWLLGSYVPGGHCGAVLFVPLGQ